jgi:glycyl-tRNA synthetase
VTERQALFGRMRDLSRRVAEAYMLQRQRLEFPWLEDKGGWRARPGEESFGAWEKRSRGGRERPAPVSAIKAGPFLLEIGTEELPAGDLEAALEQLRERAPGWLDELRLEHGAVRVMGTPRRLVVYVYDLAPTQTTQEQVIKGPPANRAFGADGAPTPAAEGFARSKGLAVADLEVREVDGGQYAVAVVRLAGRATAEVLAEALPGLIAGLRFDKPMRWNASNVYFSRPIRWLLALYGEGEACQVVPFEYAGLYSGDVTRGLRFHQPEAVRVWSHQEYFEFLDSQGILLDTAERREAIQAQVEELAAQAGGAVEDDPALLREVANLVERPTALRGSFDASHLKLPRPVLVSVMKKHQRYFPVALPATAKAGEADGDPAAGELAPYFIAVRNGDEQGLDIVTDGNEHVIRARFADAAFFIGKDLKKTLDEHLSRLDTLAFQARLGSMLDKVGRIVRLTEDLAPQLGLSEEQRGVARRAAELCKADLATQMVVEMTSLQGAMGRYYALRSGEAPEVAEAIFEHYLPRYAGDRSPEGLPGLAVGLADRLDSLAGLFAVDLAPSGNKDPFAQRRAALGLVQNLIAKDLDFDLRKAIQAAAAHLPVQASAESLEAVLAFIVERLRNILLEGGRRYDVVDAVLAAQGNNLAGAAKAAQALEAWTRRPDWHTILPAYARCVRITRDLKERYKVSKSAFVEEAESELYAALREAEARRRAPGSPDDFLEAFLPMIPRINRFFDEVLVMAEDERLRRNRLGLLQRVAGLAEGVAEMARLEGF